MQPPPAPRSRSKMDSLIFMPDSIKTANMEEHVASSSVPRVHDEKQGIETAEKEVESEIEVENVGRPVDLYKAIFSDDSDDEEETTVSNQVEDPQKKIEAANTTLNRLIAGDFLESLGKELGLVVPPEMPPSENKAGPKVAQKETVNADRQNGESLMAEKNQTAKNVVGSSTNGETKENKKPDDPSNTEEGRHKSKNRNHSRSSGSSEDERIRKHSRSHKHKSRSSSSDSDMSDDSDDYWDRRHSSSRRKDKGTSREKSSSSRRHSKHRKHRRKDSPSRSHRSSGKDQENRKRKKNKYDK